MIVRLQFSTEGTAEVKSKQAFHKVPCTLTLNEIFDEVYAGKTYFRVLTLKDHRMSTVSSNET